MEGNIMRTSGTLLAAAMLVLVGAVAADAKKPKTKTSHFSGSNVPTDIDTNGDGMTALFSVGRGKIGKGRGLPQQYTVDSLYEYLPALGTNVNCPQGWLEFPVYSGHTVTHDVDADNLYGQNTSGFSCLDLATGGGFFSYAETIIGGTGKFAGATGTATSNGTYTFLSCDSSGRCYSAFEGDNEFTITTP
jgi:hypothetical protein